MRVTVNIKTAAIADAMRVAPDKTRAQVINEALREYARRRRLRGLLKFGGKCHWEGDLDDLRGRRGVVVVDVFQGLRKSSEMEEIESLFREMTFLEPTGIDSFFFEGRRSVPDTEEARCDGEIDDRLSRRCDG